MKMFRIVLWGLVILGFGFPVSRADEPAIDQTRIEKLERQLKENKNAGSRFRIVGELLAADPQRIPTMLPAELSAAASFKGAGTYVQDLLRPCTKEAVPTLIKMLQNEGQPNDQAQAQFGLSHIIDAARPAVSQVLNQQRSIGIRTRAVQILGTDRTETKAGSLQALAKHLADESSALRIEVALAMLQLKPDAADATAVLVRDFSNQPKNILRAAFNARESKANWREVLALGFQEKSNRAWRAKCALELAELDGKLTPANYQAVIEGLYTNNQERANLAEECAVALAKYPEFKTESLQHLNRICESNDSLRMLAVASASILRLDPTHSDLRLPVVLTAIVTRSRFATGRLELILLVGELKDHAHAAEPTLRKLMENERDPYRAVLALVYLQIQPAETQPAIDLLRNGLGGKLNYIGQVGLNRFTSQVAGLDPLFPDMLAALDSEQAQRRRLAEQLLRISGSSARSLLPELEKRLKAVEATDRKELREIIATIKAARP